MQWRHAKMRRFCVISKVQTPIHVSATPTVLDSATHTIIDNGITHFEVDKNDGHLSSLRLNGQELLGCGGRVYFDANSNTYGSASAGGYWNLGSTNPVSYS